MAEQAMVVVLFAPVMAALAWIRSQRDQEVALREDRIQRQRIRERIDMAARIVPFSQRAA